LVTRLAGVWPLIAAHGLAGGTVAGGERGQAGPDEDAVGGGGGDAAPGGQPYRSDAMLAPQAHDALLEGARRAAWLVVRAAGAVLHPGGPVPAVAVGPACGGGVADLETLRGPPHRPAVLDDTPGQTQPAGRGQRGIAVDQRRPPGIRL
jgi:hypothetical protein